MAKKRVVERHKKNNLETVSGYTVFKYDEMEKIKDLVEDLGWDHQRMTASGKLSYERLTRMLGWEFES
tara:strand:- start:467 stop:670 length:204 start_codon:yes stop_codon:yes gene_type:complete